MNGQEPIISIEKVRKEFKVLNRHEGLKGAFKDLFSKDYKKIVAVNDVSMDIMPGEIVGYLGPNGAGKSTTIKMMTGVLEPTSGNIVVNDKVPYKNRTQNANQIGVVFGQRTQLWWALPVIESFKILKDMYRIDDKTYRDNLLLFDSLVGVKELYSKPVREMSLGQRTLCDILAAFLHNPKIVFLDEPTIGLDVSMKSKIRELIKALNKEKGTTVILTTHDMGDVDALCKRIVIIDHGTMLYDNSIENLRSFFGAYRTARFLFSKDVKECTKEKLSQTRDEIKEILTAKFPDADSLTVSLEDEWIDILINEDEVKLMEIVNTVQDYRNIIDLKLQEISTESVIKKIYDDEDKAAYTVNRDIN